MGTSTLERARVTITIPADCIDDFRVGLLADLKIDVENFGVENGHMLEAKDDERLRSDRRQDRDGRIKNIRCGCELLEQLPGEDVEAVVTGNAEAIVFALEEAGRQLTERVRREFEYGPVPVQELLPLVERLRWTVEQAATIEGC